MSEPLHHAKYVTAHSAQDLNHEELAQVVALLVSRLGLTIYQTKYISHGDEPTVAFTLEEYDSKKAGFFERE